MSVSFVVRYLGFSPLPRLMTDLFVVNSPPARSSHTIFRRAGKIREVWRSFPIVMRTQPSQPGSASGREPECRAPAWPPGMVLGRIRPEENSPGSANLIPRVSNSSSSGSPLQDFRDIATNVSLSSAAHKHARATLLMVRRGAPGISSSADKPDAKSRQPICFGKSRATNRFGASRPRHQSLATKLKVRLVLQRRLRRGFGHAE